MSNETTIRGEVRKTFPLRKRKPSFRTCQAWADQASKQIQHSLLVMSRNNGPLPQTPEEFYSLLAGLYG